MKKPTPNVALRVAIVKAGKEQRQIAKLARVSPEKLSHAIYGRRGLNDDERARVAKVLGYSVTDLFREHDAALEQAS